MPFPYVFPFVFPSSPSASILTPDRSVSPTRRRRGLLEAMLDSAAGIMNELSGQAVTRLSNPLAASVTTAAGVETTLGFGELVDGTLSAKFLVGGEIIIASGRTQVPPYGFVTLTRGVDGTEPKTHPAGAVVLDMSGNTSAFHFMRRGLFVNTAVEEDLDVIARNHGIHKCFGLTVEQWRRVIKVLAYLPKQPISAFEDVIMALVNDENAFRVTERPWSDPYKVFIEVDVPASIGDEAIEGRFVLTGGEEQLSTGALSVNTTYAIGHVLGVYAATQRALYGERAGLTNYFSGGGSFVGSTITLGSSPGGAGTPLIIDYTTDAVFNYHYLAADENVIAEIDDRRPYFGDLYGPLAECLANEVRSAGILPVVTTRSV